MIAGEMKTALLHAEISKTLACNLRRADKYTVQVYMWFTPKPKVRIHLGLHPYRDFRPDKFIQKQNKPRGNERKETRTAAEGVWRKKTQKGNSALCRQREGDAPPGAL